MRRDQTSRCLRPNGGQGKRRKRKRIGPNAQAVWQTPPRAGPVWVRRPLQVATWSNVKAPGCLQPRSGAKSARRHLHRSEHARNTHCRVDRSWSHFDTSDRANSNESRRAGDRRMTAHLSPHHFTFQPILYAESNLQMCLQTL